MQSTPALAAAAEPVPADSKPDWSALLVQHDRWLRTVAFARLGEWEAVNEVMQEVALAAVRQQAPLADVAKAAPWLYRLTVTQSLLYRRKMGRRRKLLARFGERQAAAAENSAGDPLEWLLAEERQQRVREALQKLPRGEAEILLLKYTEDWSYHQIAAQLGLSHAAVEARLYRARNHLRREMELAAAAASDD